MEPVYNNKHVVALCPDCNAISNFIPVQGVIIINSQHILAEKGPFQRIIYQFLKCSCCERPAIAKLHDNDSSSAAYMESFYPTSIKAAELPSGLPHGIEAEYREAELCASAGAWRAASGMLRSALEKTLRANGYQDGSLAQKIDAAADDRIITESRRRQAHDEIKVLGNDVLHDDWRKVDVSEFEKSHHYLQRVLEDFYDDRQAVEAVLTEKNRHFARLTTEQVIEVTVRE